MIPTMLIAVMVATAPIAPGVTPVGEMPSVSTAKVYESAEHCQAMVAGMKSTRPGFEVYAFCVKVGP